MVMMRVLPEIGEEITSISRWIMYKSEGRAGVLFVRTRLITKEGRKSQFDAGKQNCKHHLCHVDGARRTMSTTRLVLVSMAGAKKKIQQKDTQRRQESTDNSDETQTLD